MHHPYFTWTTGAEAPPTPPVVVGEAPRTGGKPFFLRPPRKRRIDEEVIQVIQQVARDQVERLEADEQKRFEQLERELELRSIEWEGRHLEYLNEYREFLIEQEIGRLLRKKISDEEEELITLLAAIL